MAIMDRHYPHAPQRIPTLPNPRTRPDLYRLPPLDPSVLRLPCWHPHRGEPVYAAIAYRGTGTHGNSTTSVTLNVPTGVVSGDVMYAQIYTDGTLTTPTGWILLDGSGVTTAAKIGIYRRVSPGGEPASYTWTPTGAPTFTGGMIDAFSGVDNTTPEDAATTKNQGSTATITFPNITTVTDNAWHYTLAEDDTNIPGTPAGYTNRQATIDGSSDTKLITPAGLVTGVTTTTGTSWVAWSVALRPASGVTADGPNPTISRRTQTQLAPAAVRAGALFRQGSTDGPATVIQLVSGAADFALHPAVQSRHGRVLNVDPSDGPSTVILLVEGATDFALHPAVQSRRGRVLNAEQVDGPATVIQLVEGMSFVLRPAQVQKFGRVVTSADIADALVAVGVEQFDVVSRPARAQIHGRAVAGDAADVVAAVAPTTGWESDFTGRLPYRGPTGIRLMLTQTVPWDGSAPPPVVAPAPTIIYLPKINRFAIRLSDTLYEIL